MITRKSKTTVSSTTIWPYTPEPSPPLEATPIRLAVDDDITMSSEQLAVPARPISIVSRRDGALSPSARPTLDDVLNNRAPAPYTLAAYTAFLSQQHCLETLEFVIEAKKYSNKYDENVAHYAGMPFSTDVDEGFELMQDWLRILDVFVKPGAPREINLPAEERDDLIDYPYEPKPPPGEALDPAVKRMYDLMSDSIFIPFCNSLKSPIPHGHTFSAPSELTSYDVTLHPFNERLSRPQNTRRKRSPPVTSGAVLEPNRSPTQNRPSGASALTSSLNRTSDVRLSTHISHSSAASDGAMTDDSSAGYSPAGADPDVFMSPPTTPPQSELPFQPGPIRHHGSSSTVQRSSRIESGGTWKKMGFNKFFNKKKGSSEQ